MFNGINNAVIHHSWSAA